MVLCRKIDNTYNFLSGIFANQSFIWVWVFIVAVQILLGQFGGQFFSVFSGGLSGLQWAVVLLSALVVVPVSLMSKFLVFEILKLGDGEDDLEEESHEEHDEQNKKLENGNDFLKQVKVK